MEEEDQVSREVVKNYSTQGKTPHFLNAGENSCYRV